MRLRVRTASTPRQVIVLLHSQSQSKALQEGDRTMKVIHFAIVCCFILTSANCKHGTEPSPQPSGVRVEGSVHYYIDSVLWIGGECDPSGFILSDYRWSRGEPSFPYYRVYLRDSTLAQYLTMNVLIEGKLDTIVAGGIETPLRRFPVVDAKSILIIR